MSGLFSTPDAPDPAEVALLQSRANREATADSARYSAINQVSPDGTRMTWSGTPGVIGSGGLTVTQTLSPAQQSMLNKSNAISNKALDVGQTQLDNVSGTLGTPLNLGSFDPQAQSATQAQKYYQDYMASDVDRQRAGLEQRLANQGIFPGTEAYTRASREFQANADQNRNKFLMDYQNQAFNQGMQGRTQHVNEALTQRNQPLQELNALRSGSQISQPTFQNTPTYNVNPAAYDQYAMNNYNQQVAQQGQLWGALGNAAGTAASMYKMSDRRVKADIKKVGKLDDGTKVYRYRYKGSPMMELGVMAQEVEKTRPEAVAETDGGIKMVNYGKLMGGLG